MKVITNKAISPDKEQDILALYKQTADISLLGNLYAGYMTLVYGVCLKYLKDEAKSQDAVMQLFEELVEKLKKHEVSNFKPWLYSVARNYCLMQLRADSKQSFVDINEAGVEKEAFTNLDIEDTTEQNLLTMEQCLETLNEEQRKSIELFYLQQKCYQEVAAVTGYEMNKVKSYIQNGKRNLKLCMEKTGENNG